MAPKHERGDLTDDVESGDPRETTQQAESDDRGVDDAVDEHDPREMTEDSRNHDPRELVETPEADEPGTDR